MKALHAFAILLIGLGISLGISSCCCCIPPNAKADLTIGPEFPATLHITDPGNYPLLVPVINHLYTSVEKCDNRRTEYSREDTLFYAIREPDTGYALDSGFTLLPVIKPEETYQAPFVLSTSLVPQGTYHLDLDIGGEWVRDRDTSNNRLTFILIRD